MKEVDLFTSQKHRIAVSFLCMFFITYPNVMWIPWNVANLQSGSQLSFWGSFIFRCVFFFILFYFQIGYNIKKINNSGFVGRFGKNILYSFIAGVLFLAISYLVPLFGIQSGTVAKHLTFQFLVVSLLCTFIGYIADLNNAKRQKEKLIEQLKIESLQSRYDALA
ncbi:MAG: histidine kinase, partial [Muribaculaceae bacterium]|nr:histidine kinase [Muribaculaceae bacterium]